MAALNDLFVNAFEVTVPTNGATYTYVGDVNSSNSSNGMEAGEPQPTSFTSGRSGWWKYTPASSGTITVDTEPSNGSALDTELGIYTGTAVNALTKVASDSDSGSGNKSLITGLAVTAGTTYYIQVTTYQSAVTCQYGINLTGPASLPAGSATGTMSGRLPALSASLSGSFTTPAYATEALADGPAALYLHNDTSGTTATDSSGNGLNATYVGGVTLADTTDPALGSLPHVRLDGSTGYIQLPAVAAPPSGWLHPDAAGMTVEAWVYLRSNRDWARLVDFTVSASSERLYIVPRTSANQLGVHSYGTFQGSTTLATGAWKLVTLTVAADGVVRLYINGTQQATATLGNPSDLALPYLYIGKSAYPADPLLDASIGPIAIYNSVLSAARVSAHASATLAPPAASGTMTATLPALGANLSGGVTYSGTMTATLPPLGASLAGTSLPPGVSGALSAVLPSLGGSLAGAYSDTATLAAILPPLSANLTGTVAPPPVTGSLSATLPGLSANLVGQAFEPGVGGYLEALLPALSAAFSGDALGRTGLGIGLDSDAVLTVVEVLEPEPTVPAGTSPTVLHVIAPTVPVPTLVAGRPQ